MGRRRDLGGRNIEADVRRLIPYLSYAGETYQVKVSDDDTTPGELAAKITAVSPIVLTVLNDAADEDLQISLDDSAAAVTLDANADVFLSLNVQEIGVDSQAANLFLASPSGAAGVMAPRAIVDADLPVEIARVADLHDPVTGGYGVIVTGQEVAIDATVIAEVADLHDPVTLNANITTLLNLSGQELSLDTQAANAGFFGPTSGGAAAPTFRAMVDADIPASIARASELHDPATAGDGIDITGQVVSVDVTDVIGNGLVESSNNIAIGTPGSVTVTSSNGVTASSHTHAVVTTATGANSTIVATNSSGGTRLSFLGVGTSAPTTTSRPVQIAGAQTQVFVSIEASATTAAGYVGFGVDGNDLLLRAGNANRAILDSAGGFYVGDDVNSKSTRGITINQGSYDDHIFTLKSSDVAHGMTSLAETDSYLYASKYAAASGGAGITGLSEASVALHLAAVATTTSTAKSSSATGALNLFAGVKSGTSGASMSSTQNLVSIQNWGSTVALFAADGDLYLDTVTNSNSWDDYDDMELLNGFRAAMVPDGHILRRRFGRFMEEAKEILERTGVAIFNDDGHHFVATKKLQMLTIDAVRQKNENDVRTFATHKTRIDENKQEIFRLKQRIAVLEAAT